MERVSLLLISFSTLHRRRRTDDQLTTVSWDAWPQGATDKTDESDKLWKAAVGSKAYMMPVSPWFYANLPDKNWVWRGDDMWHERWQQVLEVQPNFVEVSKPIQFENYTKPVSPELVSIRY